MMLPYDLVSSAAQATQTLTESNPDLPVIGVQGLLVLSAIPVVTYALWCDYFERYVAELKESGEKIDKAEELYRVRTANLFAILFQFLVFFGTIHVRRAYPWLGYPLFAAVMTAHLWIQNGLERKIRENPDAGSTLGQAFRTFFWSTLAGGLYLAVLLGSVLIFSAAATALHAPPPLAITLLLMGVAAGVTGGLCLSFALAPWFVRKLFRCSPITEGPLHDSLKGAFEGASLPTPSFWRLESDQLHSSSAMMAGFQHGRGAMRPSLFLAAGAIDSLKEDELRAVVLHEVSHLRLKHLRKRFVFSAGLVLCASIITGAIMLTAATLLPEAQIRGLIGCFAIVISFSIAFRCLAEQSQYHEIAADIDSIETLGSSLPSLSSALRKLDILSDSLLDRKDFGTTLLGMGHPATEKRIRALEIYFERKHAATPPVESDTDSHSRAA